MTSINDSTLMPAALRDTRRMNQFVSVAAGRSRSTVWSGYRRYRWRTALYYRPLYVKQPPARVGGEQHDAGRGHRRVV